MCLRRRSLQSVCGHQDSFGTTQIHHLAQRAKHDLQKVRTKGRSTSTREGCNFIRGDSELLLWLKSGDSTFSSVGEFLLWLKSGDSSCLLWQELTPSLNLLQRHVCTSDHTCLFNVQHRADETMGGFQALLKQRALDSNLFHPQPLSPLLGRGISKDVACAWCQCRLLSPCQEQSHVNLQARSPHLCDLEGNCWRC